jgi:hypothetical protein
MSNMIVAALLLLSPLLLTSAQTDTPYFMTFHHPQYNLISTCNTEFHNIRDFIYKDYVKDVIATSYIDTTTAFKLDYAWNTTTYVWPTTSISTTAIPPSTVRRLGCSSTCLDKPMIVMANGCCGTCPWKCYRRLTEEERGSNRLRKLQQTSTSTLDGLEPVRNATGLVVVKNKGNVAIVNSTSTLQGTKIAKEFYNAVEKYLAISDPCRQILLGASYETMEMKVV